MIMNPVLNITVAGAQLLQQLENDDLKETIHSYQALYNVLEQFLPIDRAEALAQLCLKLGTDYLQQHIIEYSEDLNYILMALPVPDRFQAITRFMDAGFLNKIIKRLGEMLSAPCFFELLESFPAADQAKLVGWFADYLKNVTIYAVNLGKLLTYVPEPERLAMALNPDRFGITYIKSRIKSDTMGLESILKALPEPDRMTLLNSLLEPPTNALLSTIIRNATCLGTILRLLTVPNQEIFINQLGGTEYLQEKIKNATDLDRALDQLPDPASWPVIINLLGGIDYLSDMIIFAHDLRKINQYLPIEDRQAIAERHGGGRSDQPHM
jgi:hypothetical protein